MFMRNYLILLYVFILFVSCSSNGKKKISDTAPTQNSIIFVDETDGYHAAYTMDGHTIIYMTDSVGNYIVYYVKFENGAGNYGLKRIEEKMIRAEMDSSLNNLKGFVTFVGGAFIDVKEGTEGYTAYYYDEQLKEHSMKQIDYSSDMVQTADIGESHELNRIILLLDVAYQFARSINTERPRGWDKIVSALEPVHNILSYNVIFNNSVNTPREEEHILRIEKATKELTHFYNMLHEK